MAFKVVALSNANHQMKDNKEQQILHLHLLNRFGYSIRIAAITFGVVIN